MLRSSLIASVAAVLASGIHGGVLTSQVQPGEFSHSGIVLASAEDVLASEAQGFITALSQEGIAFLADPSLSSEERASKFRTLLKKNFDMETIGKFSLGRYWSSASAAQQKKYLSLFEEMIVKVYSQRFGDYQGQDLTVAGARPEGKQDTLVTSFIVPKSGQKIQVDWRVRKKGGQFKVVDVVVEGVSMALTQRSDFSSVIQRGGGDIEVLIAHLDQRQQ